MQISAKKPKYCGCDISEVMVDIAAKQKIIRRLTSDKHRVYAQIRQKMNTKAVAKIKMSPKQIDEYRKFAHVYECKLRELDKKIGDLGETLKKTQVVMLTGRKPDANIYDTLKRAEHVQSGIICGLEVIVNMGEQALARL